MVKPGDHVKILPGDHMLPLKGVILYVTSLFKPIRPDIICLASNSVVQLLRWQTTARNVLLQWKALVII